MKTLLLLLCLLFSVPASAQIIPKISPKRQSLVLTWRDSIGQVVQAETSITVSLPYKHSFQTYHPPAIYKTWWKEIEKCTNLPISDASENAIKFYYVDAHSFYFDNLSIQFVGYTFAPTHRIYIVYRDITNPRIVKHEMIHVLMYEHGLPEGHPKNLFRDDCKVDHP